MKHTPKIAAILTMALTASTSYLSAQDSTAGTAAKGAVVGAVAGAVIGNNVGNRNAGQGAIIGAVVGAGTAIAIREYNHRNDARSASAPVQVQQSVAPAQHCCPTSQPAATYIEPKPHVFLPKLTGNATN